MKKAILYVFSGTGNTLLLAKEYKKHFENNDIETTIYMIDGFNYDIPDANDYDIVGIGYPIYAFNAPQIVIKFAKCLNRVNGKYTFIFKSSGEPLKLNDASSSKLICILKRKGYRVSLERHIVMPYTMIFRQPDEMAKQLWTIAKKLVEFSATDVMSQKVEKVKQPIYKKLHTAPLRIQWPGGKMNGLLYKVDTDKCIKCMKCVKDCPTKNIKYEDEKFNFGNDCAMCMRCSFNCPVNAIKIGMFNKWKVNGSYKLDKLEQNEKINDVYVNERTKGLYGKVYKPYIKKTEQLIKNEENKQN